ncbi:hypothetical protein SCUCBS95973_001835 [Sporothrix curviconia]|uniref:Protein YOP1 n=1 Tax=Sporothrix curviconia TaxID=1260050 RepID=A0ABP0B1S4_9PEZI
MFDILPKALASVASFLFPLFASYKALNTSDPAQLTPWLMYWVVLSVVVLVESWTDWILVWVPFYQYFRLFFLLYLVLPQTQGARVLYQTHLHPWLAQHEAQIDEFIGSSHARMRSAGIHYLKQAIAYLRTALGLPAAPDNGSAQNAAASASHGARGVSAQSYTQSLLARFTLPSARWPGGAMGSAAAAATSDPAVPSSGADFYNLLANAVGALGTATGAAGGVAAGAAASALGRGIAGFGSNNSTNNNYNGNNNNGNNDSNMSASGTLIPPHIQEADRASFLATQRERLRTLLSALEREAAQLEDEDETLSKTFPLSRPLSSASGLSKSRSEADFEKIDAESGAEEDTPLRQRRQGGGGGGNSHSDAVHPGAGKRSSSGSWMPWGWGGGGTGAAPGPDGSLPEESEAGQSSAVEQ